MGHSPWLAPLVQDHERHAREILLGDGVCMIVIIDSSAKDQDLAATMMRER
jgi:hypothetical protein